MFILCCLACGIHLSASESKASATVEDVPETRIYQVFGMDCPGCHGGLEKLVKKIPEVREAKANFKEQQLVVTIDSGKTLDDESVHDAIKRSNFTAGKRIK